MNANEVNEVINNICDKIGIGVENAKQFVPALAKYEIVHNAMWGIILLIVFICMLMLIRHLYLTRKKGMQGDCYFDELPYDVGLIICGICAVILLPITCDCFVNMVEWIVSPNVKAINYVLGFVKWR